MAREAPRAGTRLEPMAESPEMYEALEEALLAAIRRHVFLPLLREVAPAEAERKLRNSLDDLIMAVASGEIQYVNGRFEGRFRAAVSRELRRRGATYDRRRKCFTIPYRELPVDVQIAIGTSRSAFQRMAERAERALARVVPEEVAEAIDMAKLLDSSVFYMDRQFLKNVSRIGVVPRLSEETRRYIAQEYTRTTKLDIKEWTRKEITRLRKAVHKNTFEYGIRRETLVADIQKQYGVSSRKAKFLARQETSLLMASFQETRYAEAGVKRYEWVCVNNPPHWITGPEGGKRLAPHSVRPDHWELNHTIQLWSSPPVVDKRTGRRRHPKQDYNCRCTAIPIVD